MVGQRGSVFRAGAAALLALSSMPAFADLMPSPNRLLGDWRQLPPRAPEVQALIGPALAAIPRHVRFRGVLRAESQSFGSQARFRLFIALADGSGWRVILVRQGDGSIHVTHVEPVL